MPGLTQQSNDEGGLVGGDRPGDADDDAPWPLDGGHGAFTHSSVRLVHGEPGSELDVVEAGGSLAALERDRSIQRDVAEHVGLCGSTGLLGLGAAGAGHVPGDDLELVLGDLTQSDAQGFLADLGVDQRAEDSTGVSSCWV